MSVAEMKLKAISQITKLNEENSLKEILEHLSKLNIQNEINLSQHYADIKSKYGDVLKKLAQ